LSSPKRLQPAKNSTKLILLVFSLQIKEYKNALLIVNDPGNLTKELLDNNGRHYCTILSISSVENTPSFLSANFFINSLYMSLSICFFFNWNSSMYISRSESTSMYSCSYSSGLVLILFIDRLILENHLRFSTSPNHVMSACVAFSSNVNFM
jgi:hypothetical protein